MAGFLFFTTLCLTGKNITIGSDAPAFSLLDENGKAFSSKAFAETVENHQNMGVRNLVFIIGGAFGFSENIYLTFDKKIRLSDMTFSHQMIRLFFCEQLYRAYTIINKHPYHNS